VVVEQNAAGLVSSASSRLRDEVRTIDMRVQELSGRASELNDVMAAFNVGDVTEEDIGSPALGAATEYVKLYDVNGGRL